MKRPSPHVPPLLVALASLCATPLAPAAPEIPAPRADAAVPVLPDALRGRMSLFFTALQQGKVEVAYTRLFEGSAPAKENPELVNQLVASTTRLLGVSGVITTSELIRVRKAGHTVLEATYLVNGAKRPVRWVFYFYLNKGEWSTLDTSVSTEARTFFDDPHLLLPTEAEEPAK